MIPVFMASDDNYVKYMAVTITSIISGTSQPISFYILDGGISSRNKGLIWDIVKGTNHSLEYITIDINQFSNFPSFRYTLNMYSRFLIPNLKPDIKKAIYVDVDTVFVGDIKEIFDTDLKNNIIGAVPCLLETESPENYAKIKKKLGLPPPPEHRYFNSGLLIINCEFWRNNDMTEKLLKRTNELLDILELPDQDILNVMFQNKYLELPQQWNIIADILPLYRNFSEYINALNGCFVLHFTGGNGVRPWINKGVVGERYFWKFASTTPFYQELKVELLLNISSNSLKVLNKLHHDTYKKTIKFLFIPILKIRKKQLTTRVSLFGIQILKIKTSAPKKKDIIHETT